MKKLRWLMVLVAVGLLSSCSMWEPDMGNDLLPPGDKVFLFHDTIFEISATTVPSLPLLTSDRSLSATTVYLLGAQKDSLSGITEASIFTQFNPSGGFMPASNTDIDSVILYLYSNAYQGAEDAAITVRLYESTTRIYMDSLYYSDFPLEGSYNSEILLSEATYLPDGSDSLKLVIEDLDFINKFMDVQTKDTTIFWSDSAFKEHFNGFYLTATSENEEGGFASIALSNAYSRLMVRYANDSVEVDSTAERDFRWAMFNINEFSSQKINVFSHDYTGTPLAGMYTDSLSSDPHCYVQGLAGVDTRLTFDGLDKWLEGGEVAISSAELIFDVVDEKDGGIALEELPWRKMLFVEDGEDDLDNLYDYYVIAQSGSDASFGGYLAPEAKGMFFDTTYSYRFDVGLHFQYLIDGELANNALRLRVYDENINPKISRIWSNLYTNPKRIRLEVAYLKL